MQITLSPVASNRDTTVEVSGLTVTVDGVDYDLSVIPEGGDAQPDDGEPFMGTMTRDAVTVLYHYDTTRSHSQQPTDPSKYVFTVTDGPVPDPIKRRDS